MHLFLSRLISKSHFRLRILEEFDRKKERVIVVVKKSAATMSEGHQIFIARLPRDTRAEDIEAVFKRYGPMRRCDVRSGTSALVRCRDSRLLLLQAVCTATRLSFTRIAEMLRYCHDGEMY